MSRHIILSSIYSCIVAASAFAQLSTLRPLTDTESAKIDTAINSVKELPAHRLDRRLPQILLAEWLRAQAGADTKINWAYRSEPGARAPDWRVLPDAVEADIALKNEHSIVLQVAITYCDGRIKGCRRHVPSVFRIYVITGKDPTTGKFESAELNRLSDLPLFLQTLKQTSSEAQR